MVMNKKTNTWAALVGSETISEAIQRIAFSFGYEWIQNGAQVSRKDAPVLCFNPNNKTITYEISRIGLEDKVCDICVSLDAVMNKFVMPPVPTEKRVGAATLFKDGSVYLDACSIRSKDMDELIKARDEFLGRTKKVKLPVVQFDYNSPSSGNRPRKIMVVDTDNTYLKGLDMDDGNQYKEFRRDRIKGVVWFTGLEESKEK